MTVRKWKYRARLFDFDLQSLLRRGQHLSLQTFFKKPLQQKCKGTKIFVILCIELDSFKTNLSFGNLNTACVCEELEVKESR